MRTITFKEMAMDRLFVGGLIILCVALAGPSQATVAANSAGAERPLIVASDRGEVRAWRSIPSDTAAVQKISTFTIKIDKQNGGSPDFWFGTETLPVGAEIPYHRHLHEDEMLYVDSGIAHVHVGGLEGDARAGGIVFIPRNTWVSVRNTGKKPVLLLFAFNAPGFDRYMRCESVAAGEQPTKMTNAEDRNCTRLGDVQYR
jgi:mannose-6-phosphate isomerase-like protein (cupin superfamily)